MRKSKRDPILDEMERRQELVPQTFFDLTGKYNSGFRQDGGMPLFRLARRWKSRRKAAPRG
jgi:hypothetical protein